MQRQVQFAQAMVVEYHAEDLGITVEVIHFLVAEVMRTCRAQFSEARVGHFLDRSLPSDEQAASHVDANELAVLVVGILVQIVVIGLLDGLSVPKAAGFAAGEKNALHVAGES